MSAPCGILANQGIVESNAADAPPSSRKQAIMRHRSVARFQVLPDPPSNNNATHVLCKHNWMCVSQTRRSRVAPEGSLLRGPVIRKQRTAVRDQAPRESFRHYGFPPGIGTISSPLAHSACRRPGSGLSTRTTPAHPPTRQPPTQDN